MKQRVSIRIGEQESARCPLAKDESPQLKGKINLVVVDRGNILALPKASRAQKSRWWQRKGLGAYSGDGS